MPRLRVVDEDREIRIEAEGAYYRLLSQDVWRVHIRREAERIARDFAPSEWHKEVLASITDAEESRLFTDVLDLAKRESES